MDGVVLHNGKCIGIEPAISHLKLDRRYLSLDEAINTLFAAVAYILLKTDNNIPVYAFTSRLSRK